MQQHAQIISQHSTVSEYCFSNRWSHQRDWIGRPWRANYYNYQTWIKSILVEYPITKLPFGGDQPVGTGRYNFAMKRSRWTTVVPNLHPSFECQPVHSLKLTANAPENRPSQKETSIPTIHFQVRTVSFREGHTLSVHGSSLTMIWGKHEKNIEAQTMDGPQVGSNGDCANCECGCKRPAPVKPKSMI